MRAEGFGGVIAAPKNRRIADLASSSSRPSLRQRPEVAIFASHGGAVYASLAGKRGVIEKCELEEFA
jgi:hypothetical protein